MVSTEDSLKIAYHFTYKIAHPYTENSSFLVSTKGSLSSMSAEDNLSLVYSKDILSLVSTEDNKRKFLPELCNVGNVCGKNRVLISIKSLSNHDKILLNSKTIQYLLWEHGLRLSYNNDVVDFLTWSYSYHHPGTAIFSWSYRFFRNISCKYTVFYFFQKIVQHFKLSLCSHSRPINSVHFKYRFVCLFYWVH